MKTITFVRHAKSSWNHGVPDFERPLNNRGLKDALLVSSYIKNKIRKPQAIYTSTANRAKTTANLFIENLEWNNLPYLEKDKLYDFSGNDLVNEIKNFPSNIEHIIVFGHNHAITAIVNTFGSIRFNNVPTCGLVQIEFSIINWEDLNKGKTTFHIFPKLLKQAL